MADTSHPFENPITPPRLHHGDLIALVSPSARLNTSHPDRLSRGIKHLEGLGFRTLTIFTPIPTSASHHAQILHRCEEIHQAFLNPEVKAIICTLGGDHANELLPFLDYEMIRKNPKVFVGYSDITTLHMAFWRKAGLRTYYGPDVMSSFAEEGDGTEILDFVDENFLRVVLHDDEETTTPRYSPMPRSTNYTTSTLSWTSTSMPPPASRTLPSPSPHFLRPGHATGPLLGGCITTVSRLLCTPYSPIYTSAILLLEDPMGPSFTPFPLDRWRTILTDLGNAGMFDRDTGVRGIVMGRAVGYDVSTEEGREGRGRWLKIIKDVVGVYVDGPLAGEREGGFPVLVDVDIGHSRPILTVPLGEVCTLDSEAEEGGGWSFEL